MPAGTIALLGLQVVLAVVGIRELRRHVFPALGELVHPGLVLEVWAPLVIAAPLLVGVMRIEGSVTTLGWLPLAGPVVAGWAAVGAALVVAGRHAPLTAAFSRVGGPTWREPVVVTLSGLVLLLLCASHRMQTWIGQSTLVAASVLLWMNAPHESRAAHRDAPPMTRVQARAGVGLFIALVAAIGQGIAALNVDAAALPVAGGLLMGYAVIAIVSSAVAGGAAALQLGGWTAAYGVLIGLGILATVRTIPAAMGALTGRRLSVGTVVADGFGSLAPEALGLVLLGIALGIVRWIPDAGRRPAGLVILVLVALAIGLRTAEMGAS